MKKINFGAMILNKLVTPWLKIAQKFNISNKVTRYAFLPYKLIEDATYSMIPSNHGRVCSMGYAFLKHLLGMGSLENNMKRAHKKENIIAT